MLACRKIQFSAGLIFGAYFIIGRNFAFQNGLDLTIKTANSNSPWAYIREGLLSEGFLRLRFGGLLSGGLIFAGILRYYRGREATTGNKSSRRPA